MNHKPTALLTFLVLRHPCVSCPHACRKIVSRAVGFTFVGIMQEPTLDELFRDLQDALAERIESQQPQLPKWQTTDLASGQNGAVGGCPDGCEDATITPISLSRLTLPEGTPCLRGGLVLHQDREVPQRWRVVRRRCDAWGCPVCGPEKWRTYFLAARRRLAHAVRDGLAFAVGDVPLDRHEAVYEALKRRRHRGYLWIPTPQKVRAYLAALKPDVDVPADLEPIGAPEAPVWLHERMSRLVRPEKRLPGSRDKLIQLAPAWALTRDASGKPAGKKWRVVQRVRYRDRAKVEFLLKAIGCQTLWNPQDEDGWLFEVKLPDEAAAARLVHGLGGDAEAGHG